MGRTLSDEQIAELAAEHEAARQSASSIDPVSRRYPDVTWKTPMRSKPHG